jgi:hypothetical protein
MTTKAKVKALAAKQGAEFFEGRDGYGDYYAEVILPDPYIWDNGSGTGCRVQTKEREETMAEFWESMFDYIDAPVIVQNDE